MVLWCYIHQLECPWSPPEGTPPISLAYPFNSHNPLPGFIIVWSLPPVCHYFIKGIVHPKTKILSILSPNPQDFHWKHKFRYFCKEINKIVHVISVDQRSFYEATRILFVRKENKNKVFIQRFLLFPVSLRPKFTVVPWHICVVQLTQERRSDVEPGCAAPCLWEWMRMREWALLARYAYTYEEFVIVTEAPQCNRMTTTGQDTDNKRIIYKYTNRQCTK